MEKISQEVADLVRQEIFPEKTNGHHGVYCQWYLKRLTDQHSWSEVFRMFMDQVSDEEASKLFILMLINLEHMRTGELPSSLGPNPDSKPLSDVAVQEIQQAILGVSVK